jgi:hypothetical protein
MIHDTARAAPADGGPARECMLGVLALSDTATQKPAQDAACGPSPEQVASDDPTAASQRLVFDELAGTADFIESLAIGLKEAARRDGRVRVHSYLVDIVQCVAAARGAYGRISALAGLEVRQ